MAYAENTTVPVERSIGEIIALIKKAGAVKIQQSEDIDAAQIAFWLHDRLMRFTVKMPTLEQMPKVNGRHQSLTAKQRNDMAAARCRQKARALLLVIKAKLESVESGVETIEQAFLANVVMADGLTVYERIAAPLTAEYESGVVAPLMLGGPAQ